MLKTADFRDHGTGSAGEESVALAAAKGVVLAGLFGAAYWLLASLMFLD